jgi:DNA polymerase
MKRNPMAKVENPSDSQAESADEAKIDGQNLDVQKAIHQRLESLKLSGLEALPRGTGEYSFDFDDIQATATTDSPAISAAVSEKTTQHETPVQSPAKPSATAAEPSHETAKPAAKKKPTAAAVVAMTDPYGDATPESDRPAALQIVADEVASCEKCELCKTRNKTVFSVGTPTSKLVFLGEGPGEQEDLQGEPFVGESGQLLDKIFAACNFTRQDVYILNTVKCRPPWNRNPTEDELKNCWGYAERQLEIIQPEFIVCLGSVAAKKLLNTNQSIGRLRRQFHAYRGSKVMVTYHPAYLLRTSSAKKHVWEDMKMLMQEMGIKLSK